MSTHWGIGGGGGDGGSHVAWQVSKYAMPISLISPHVAYDLKKC